MNTPFVRLAAVLGFLGVLIGAFGAHGLKDVITPENKTVYQTGVEYHLVHALALLVLALSSLRGKAATWAGYLFAAGVVLFSGSLYVLAITDKKILGVITPLGGVCFLAGWVCLFVAAGTQSKD